MRVISGKNRGTKLVAPEGMTTRPTDDMLKENIFNLIGPIKPESSVLDLFAGSGQIGIEFLSRGAKSAVFVDNNIKAIKSIKQNLEKTKHTDESKVIKSSANSALSRLRGEKFDYIYLDPPYDEKNFLLEVFNIIDKSDIIKIGAEIIIETVKDFSISNVNIIKERVYGKRKVLIIGGNYDSSLSGEF